MHKKNHFQGYFLQKNLKKCSTLHPSNDPYTENVEMGCNQSEGTTARF